MGHIRHRAGSRRIAVRRLPLKRPIKGGRMIDTRLPRRLRNYLDTRREEFMGLNYPPLQYLPRVNERGPLFTLPREIKVCERRCVGGVRCKIRYEVSIRISHAEYQTLCLRPTDSIMDKSVLAIPEAVVRLISSVNWFVDSKCMPTHIGRRERETPGAAVNNETPS